MQKCSLCGGKVVNGRCEECGLPIPPENRYTLRSETVHTHKVNDEKVLHRVRQAPGKKPVYTCPEKPLAQRRAADRSRPGSDPRKMTLANLTWGIIALVLILNVLPSLLVSCSV